MFKGTQPIHIYDLSQQTLAGYLQQTIGLLPTTDFSYGGRVQNTLTSARDRLNPNAPGTFGFETAALPLDSSETQLRTACGPRTSLQRRVLGIWPRSARIPHAECRRTPVLRTLAAIRALLQPAPSDFKLKTQTSHDIEGGFRIKSGGFQMQSSIYGMDLENEIHFIPALFYNVNLDPTRRYGSETSASLRVSDTVLLRGGIAYTRAVFREGEFEGKDVPLVSRYTASGGVTWNIWQNYLVFDATVRAWSERIMDNDQDNTRAPHSRERHCRPETERRL